MASVLDSLPEVWKGKDVEKITLWNSKRAPVANCFDNALLKRKKGKLELVSIEVDALMLHRLMKVEITLKEPHGKHQKLSLARLTLSSQVAGNLSLI